MKKTKIFYWIVTVVFAVFMIFTSVPDVMLAPEAVKMIKGLGYPEYFIVFIGIAKILGGITILIPYFNRLKEWAYAGLFFDLIAAVISMLAIQGFQASMLFMILPISFLFISYFLWHKLESLKTIES